MTRRPVYRWKTVWLGILVLAFLAWAWARSPGHLTATNISMPGRWIAITQLDGNVGIFHGKPIVRSWETKVTRRPSTGTIDASYWSISLPADGGLIIAHWLLILLFLALWTPILALRWMRLNRIPAPKVDPPPPSI